MGKILLRGFLGVAPIVITVALIIWLYKECEDLVRAPIIALLGPQYYFPGLGMIIALLIIFLIGLIINTFLVQKIQGAVERSFRKIPLVKTIYVSVCDLMSFFQQGGQKQAGKVVVIELMGTKLIGLVTRDTFLDLPGGIGSEDDVAVFLPFSYQLGGMTVFIAKDKIQYIDMSVERALRFIVTAGSPSGPVKSPPKREGS